MHLALASLSDWLGPILDGWTPPIADHVMPNEVPEQER